MSEVRKCPKCGGEMAPAKVRMGVPTGLSLVIPGKEIPDKIRPIYCTNCGYVEFYKEMKEKKG